MTRRRLLTPIVALATFVALASGGAAAAVWVASASVSATASSATAGTTLTQGGGLTTTYRYSGNTSPAVGGTLAIANTGRTPLTYTLNTQLSGSTALAQKTTLQLWTGTCSTTPPTTGVTTTTLADTAPALPAAARTVAPGASVTVCVVTRIAGTDATASNLSLQGQSVTAPFRVTGVVGTSWTATASGPAITQSVYRVASAGAISCSENWWTRGVTLSAPAPANRIPGTALSYRVFDTATGAEVAVGSVDGPTGSVTIDPYALTRNGTYALTRNGTYALAIDVKDSVSGTTSPATAPIAITRTGLLLPTLHCP